VQKFLYMHTRIVYMITSLAPVKGQDRSTASGVSLGGFPSSREEVRQSPFNFHQRQQGTNEQRMFSCG